ncbi:unnamed protein product [Adineta steineri]|uniref:Helicase ATP-binding domain-containing protein n=1 Tax=Adineta steineri TaxID=433720 RepID=A0A819QBH6_9BILA|nr:unnamed protein product [Adineta steineri]CAF1367003.1 unnamed protein product [Adineta steineri]CAF4022214.1 unnamed protein product [Adineta steineri]CAF4054580.1 unnamed protein product [Adineta steineri]
MMNLGPNFAQSRFNLHSQMINNNLRKLKIYPQQRAALVALRKWFNAPDKDKTALVVLPTGAGKSGVAALAPFVLNATRVLVITPSEIITKQLIADFNGSLSPEKQSFYEAREMLSLDEISFFIEPGLAQLKSLTNTALVPLFRSRNLIIANAHKFGSHSNVNIEQIPNDLFDTVIVDEAHHYPAETWKRIIDHFQAASRRIFLTATPYRKSGPIFDDVATINEQRQKYVAYEVSRQECVLGGLIRGLEFLERGLLNEANEETRVIEIAQAIQQKLAEHDQIDSTIRHQAMVLTHTITEATMVKDIYNNLFPPINGQKKPAVTYVGQDNGSNLIEFKKGNRCVMVVCGKALEGFDCNRVSVCAILRNVQPASKVLFPQFVGRCVRKASDNDPVTATVISHAFHRQRANFDNLDKLADAGVDPEDD